MQARTIYLISPYPERQLWKKKKSIFKLPPFSLFLLKALTPPRYEILLIDESQEDIDFTSINNSIVCISIMTSNAGRGYETADILKKNGNIIIFGGIHSSALPREAVKHADSVCIGEVENVWIGLLNDIAKNRLKRVYHSRRRPYSSDVPAVSYIKGSYLVKNLISITRGCPYNCDFCSVSRFFGTKYRKRPLSSAFYDFALRGFGMFIVLDDNLTIDRDYFLALCRLIRKLGIRWVGQASIGALNDEETVKAMKSCGCSALLIGIESVSDLDGRAYLKHKSAGTAEDVIKKVHDSGILIHGSFIFGFDKDSVESFKNTYLFCIENRIETANFSILVPYPQTRVLREMVEKGRMRSFHDWDSFDRLALTFRMKSLEEDVLKKCIIRLYKDFYSLRNILGKIPLKSLYVFLLYISYTFYYRKGIKKYEEIYSRDSCDMAGSGGNK